MSAERPRTPDLLERLLAALDVVHDEAQATIDKLASGKAVNGATGLAKIKHAAKDALEDYAEASE